VCNKKGDSRQSLRPRKIRQKYDNLQYNNYKNAPFVVRWQKDQIFAIKEDFVLKSFLQYNVTFNLTI